MQLKRLFVTEQKYCWRNSRIYDHLQTHQHLRTVVHLEENDEHEYIRAL